ncbi:MAG TPA: trigger factor [Pyrinomonadaceae bacterium]|jgi:trigger factor|nr:trigger factor [Pyrinomonadaceae bacterium]
MKTEIVDVSPTRKELKIEIAAEDVRAEYDRVSDQYAQQAAVPGFRKGHATRAVVRTRYKNEIRSEVLQRLVPDAINQAITEGGLQVLGEPDVHLENEGLDKFGQEPISLHAHVEVMPEVVLGEYKGIEGARRVRPVTDETVERMISDLREASASLQPVEDRAAEVGDTVTVDFQGRYIDPPEDEDINVEAVDVVLGGEGVLQEFTDNLKGMRPDEAKTFTVKYPSDFNAKGLAGKEIEYTATVASVRRKEMPAMDDEWARSLGEEEIDTVEKLRARVRENLSERAKFESEHRLRDEILGKLIDRHEFEVPETLVEYQTNQLLQSTVRDMMQRGMNPRDGDINWESLREMMKVRADEDLRGSMLLDRIADEENIEVTDEEIEAEIARVAEGSRQTVEQVRAALTKQGGERSIADRLRNRKALDLLVENANVRDEEWREELEPIAADAEGEAQAEVDAAETDSAATPQAANAEATGGEEQR